MANLALIPARGGSKRIPRKNIRNFLGKPIIAYSIGAALRTNLFDEIIVSTDDKEISKIGSQFGASIPFIRSEKNSNDFATLADVVLEVLEYYIALNIFYDLVCVLLPTAPLVKTDAITLGFEMISNQPALSSVVPVVKFSYPIQRALSMDQNGSISLMDPTHTNSRSQDLQPAFHDSGQFYWIRTKDFLLEKSIFMSSSGAIELTEDQVQDIDSEVDWKLAELKYSLISS